MQKPGFCTDPEWEGRSDCAHCGIRELMLFSDLPESAFSTDLQPVDHFIFPPGMTLYREGEDIGAIFSVRKGLIKLLAWTEHGEQRIVRLVGARSSIGLELLDAGNTCRHTAIAVSDADVCRIPVATVDSLVARFPDLCDRIRKRLQEQLDRADEWIVKLSTGPARTRIINLVLFLKQLSANRAGLFPMLTGTDIAAIIATSPETVSRILADLKRQGLLEKVEAGHFRCHTRDLKKLLHQDHPTHPHARA